MSSPESFNNITDTENSVAEELASESRSVSQIAEWAGIVAAIMGAEQEEGTMSPDVAVCLSELDKTIDSYTIAPEEEKASLEAVVRDQAQKLRTLLREGSQEAH